jgi:hypothetical protein
MGILRNLFSLTANFLKSFTSCNVKQDFSYRVLALPRFKHLGQKIKDTISITTVFKNNALKA